MTELEIMQRAKMDMDKLSLTVREQQGQNGPYQAGKPSSLCWAI